jgi:phage pi2 protein 07
VRSERDGVVFYPKARHGKWSQRFYETKIRVSGCSVALFLHTPYIPQMLE